MSRALLFLILLMGTRAAFALSFVETSQNILLPSEVKEPLLATNEYPVFWWNFLILKTTPQTLADERMESVCQALRARTRPQVRMMFCGKDLEGFRALLTDWARDQFRRDPAPSLKLLKDQLALAQAKASLPLDPFLLGLFRLDPLSSYEDLLKILTSSLPLKIEKTNGYLFDPLTSRVLIPVQFSFPPQDTVQMRAFTAEVQSALEPFAQDFQWQGTIGPQASTYENTQQIMADVARISVVGTVLLLLQILAAVILKRWRFILLVPPVLISTAFSALVTVGIFGRIHGLTLAFGPGIVALAMDHGLHSCLNTHWRGAWRANWFGLLTTVVALAAMLFSSIPFLRQLMVFSIIGLFSGFAVYWFLHTRYSRAFSVEPLQWEPRVIGFKTALVGILLAGFILGVSVLRPDFSMQQMDYQTPQKRELMTWFFAHFDSRAPLLQIFDEDSLDRAQTFATQEGLRLRSAGEMLPPLDQQKENLQSWETVLCKLDTFTGIERQLFAPFFDSFRCGGQEQPRRVSATDLPSYLQDYVSGERSVGLWLPKTDSEAEKIKQTWQDAQSLPEIVGLFPTLLTRELRWMAPISLLLALVLLWIYYRELRLVVLSIVPFVCGMGFYSLVAVAFGFHVSFISLIATLMIFGLSLDYGIFATNLYTGRGSRPDPAGVWTSIGLAAFVTFVGFLPLLFCYHPVLVQLGQVLVYGTAGTISGSMWGVPVVDRFLRRRRRHV